MLKSKFMIATIIVVAILLILLAIGRKSVHTEIVIYASPNEVWDVLTDFKNVKDWNTVLVPKEGELATGNSISYEFYQEEGGKAAVMSAKVKSLSKDKLINQKGGAFLILTFDHKYILEADGENTKVTIHEDYRGIMVPFWNPKPVGMAYERLLKQLKLRVENNE